MASQVTIYQCPNCMAGLRYDGDSGKLVCDSCDTRFDVAVIEQLYADKEQSAAAAAAPESAEPRWDVSLSGGYSDEEAGRLRSYSCPSCAAEIICDETTAATSCPYCGNPAVVPGQFANQLKPDYVIPFKVDRDSAIAALRAYFKGKKFIPKGFADEKNIDEIKGVYIPFWLYSGETDSRMRFRATRERTYRRGKYMITETDHYRIVREGIVAFDKVPVDASSKMPDAHMDSIEPFLYGDLKPFSTAYLPGFYADKYDEDAEFCSARANERIKESTERAFYDTIVGYSTVTREYSNISLRRGDIKYSLNPVWLLSLKWNETVYLFAVNGQTGRLVGNLPVDRGKFWKSFFIIAAPLAAILAVILFWGGV